MWNHFITVKIIPSSNTSEVNKERDIYLYANMEDIKFDVGKAIETYALMNTVGKHNLGTRFSFLNYVRRQVSHSPLWKKKLINLLG